jgi:carbon starvation protein
LAVLLGGAIAMLPGSAGAAAGTGGLLLWPLFGATNQLLAGMAFMVTAFYLWRRNKPVWFVVLPMLFMIVLPAWALTWQLFNAETGWVGTFTETGWIWRFQNHRLLATIGLVTLALQFWMVVEAALTWKKAKGVLEEALPPLVKK